MTTPHPLPPSRIVLVGHCGPDSWMLKSVAERAVPGSTVQSAHTRSAAEQSALEADLLLVNRVLDGEFDDSSGIDLIRALRDLPGRRASLMLVSNYDDAQAAANLVGAMPGFGKSTAGKPETAERLRAAVRAAHERVHT